MTYRAQELSGLPDRKAKLPLGLPLLVPLPSLQALRPLKALQEGCEQIKHPVSCKQAEHGKGLH